MILMDNRECTAVQKAFKKHEIEFQLEQLPVGDVVVNEKSLCIERKEVADFLQSFRSGHLQKQLLQMQDNYEHNYLVIVGDWKALARFGRARFSVKQLCGMLVSTAVRFNVNMIHIENNSQYALVCNALINKTGDGKTVTIRDTELLRNTMSADDVKINILTAFHGIGVKTAEKLIKEEVINSILDELIKEMEK